MADIEQLVFEAIKRTPAKKAIEKMIKNKKWKSLPDEIIANARQDIEQLHKRPDGHAYWDNTAPKEIKYDLSVIVPFYNTEKFARRCIDSIISQKTEYSFEVILVDDGSPDSCGEIIDSYQGIPNVSVYHKENGGLSDARNYGILKANGEYLFFIDSDDYLSPDSFQPLLKTAKEYSADIVEGSYSTFTDDNEINPHYHSMKVSSHGDGMFGFACGKLFRQSAFFHYCFPKGYWFEDSIISDLILPNTSVTVTIPNHIYNYYMNENGITHKARNDCRSIDTFYIFEEIYDALRFYHDMPSDIVLSSVIWQMSKYIIIRCNNIGDSHLKSLFVLCSEITEKFGCLTEERMLYCSFWEREVCEAFIHKQYGRWKLASMMM